MIFFMKIINFTMIIKINKKGKRTKYILFNIRLKSINVKRYISSWYYE